MPDRAGQRTCQKDISILEKCQRKNVPMEELEEKIEDIAGIRFICQFVEDRREGSGDHPQTQRCDHQKEKDYITNSKESGYRSYHVIAYYTVQTITDRRIWRWRSRSGRLP